MASVEVAMQSNGNWFALIAIGVLGTLLQVALLYCCMRSSVVDDDDDDCEALDQSINGIPKPTSSLALGPLGVAPLVRKKSCMALLTIPEERALHFGSRLSDSCFIA
jgi:hypothetical protein